MEALNTAVDEWVAIIAGIIAIYFFVSLVVNLAQAQLSTATGDVIGHAHALQQAIAMVILLAVAASSSALVPGLQAYLSPETAPKTGAEAVDVWRGIARFVVSIVVGGIGIFTTISAVYTSLGAQISIALGAPSSTSRSIIRLLVLIGGGIITFAAVGLANWLLGLIL
jgi:hypothetical protein